MAVCKDGTQVKCRAVEEEGEIVIIAALWMLVTVTGSGDVGHSMNYKTKHDCEEAKSLALFGLTMEGFKKAETDYREKYLKYEASVKDISYEYSKTHPCWNHKPRLEVETFKGIDFYWQKTEHGYWCPIPSNDPYFSTMGVTWFSDRGEFEMEGPSGPMVGSAHDVKTAECVIQGDDQ